MHSLKLIAGLGNPGRKHERDRHNVGFWFVSRLAAGERTELKSVARYHGLLGKLARASGELWLLLPQTYMNLSGQAVAKALKDLSLAPQQMWVVHDELDLPLCRMRIRRGGSGAGHNGVLSLISSLGTADFFRFRVGIGKPARKGSPAGRHYVLGRFTRAEAARLPKIVDGVAGSLELALESGIERAMEKYNRPDALGCEELP